MVLTSDPMIDCLHHDSRMVLQQIDFVYAARAAGNIGGACWAADRLAVYFDEIGNPGRAADFRAVSMGARAYL